MAEVTHAEARQILRRLNASHFSNRGDMGERARYSIPADTERDDDIRLAAYIDQCEKMAAAHHTEVLAVEKRYETRIEELEKQVEAARDIANANHGACERAREAMSVAQDLAVAVPSRHHERVALAALHAIAHIIDNTNTTSRYCDVGELPF
jgi:hypothetical protein